MKHTSVKRTHRIRRHIRIRSEITGSSQRPRVSIFKSNKHTYVQVIDDVAGKTVVGMSNAKVKAPASVENFSGEKAKSAFALGQAIAEAMKKKGISEAVFDRGGFKYHGRVKAVAEGLRQGGIKV